MTGGPMSVQTDGLRQFSQTHADIASQVTALLGGAPTAAGVEQTHGPIAMAVQNALNDVLGARSGSLKNTATSGDTIAGLLRKAAQMYDEGDRAGAEKMKAAAQAMAEGQGGPGAGGATGGAAGAATGAAASGAGGGGAAGMVGQLTSALGQAMGSLGGLGQGGQQGGGAMQGLQQLPQQVMQGVQQIVEAATGAGADGAEEAGAGAEGAGEKAPVDQGGRQPTQTGGPVPAAPTPAPTRQV
jgi:hypothetical protein